MTSQGIYYLIRALVALVAIPFHECGHALAAWLLGDDTAKRQGRLSLNPFAHFDLLGTLCMVFAGVGWAKPVSTDPRNFKNPKWGMALTALAGPAANLLLAYLGMVAWKILYYWAPTTMITIFAARFLQYLVMMDVGLAVFNLIPIPPLDGSKVLFSLLPDRAYNTMLRYERYGMLLLWAVVLLGVGDKVEMLFVEPGEMPRRDRFKVAGVYASGMEEMDGVVVVTDIRNVQRLSEWGPDEISGYEILTRSLAGADTFARTLGRTLLYDDAEDSENLAVTSVRERYANIFDWLKAHDVNAAVVIVIMLVVAFFNMTSALLILVLERTRMIGLLKAFGMRNGCLRRIFLWRAALVTLRGLAWGNAAGLGLCLVQKWTHLVKLSSEGYLLSEVPVSLGWGWWLALNAGFVAAIVALLVIPTAVVSTVKPEETIRYE